MAAGSGCDLYAVVGAAQSALDHTSSRLSPDVGRISPTLQLLVCMLVVERSATFHKEKSAKLWAAHRPQESLRGFPD